MATLASDAVEDFTFRYESMYDEVIDKLNKIMAEGEPATNSSSSGASEDAPVVLSAHVGVGLQRLSSPDRMKQQQQEWSEPVRPPEKRCWWCCTSSTPSPDRAPVEEQAPTTAVVVAAPSAAHSDIVHHIAVRVVAMLVALKRFTQIAVIGKDDGAGSFASSTTTDSIHKSAVMLGVNQAWTDEDVVHLMDIVSSYGIRPTQ